MALTTKPESHQFEVSLFGPGVGESVVVHLGSNNWIIVDSCKTAHHQAAALEYLDGLGVDLSNDVKAVVATHWHNDHVRGLDETFTRCSSAKFICSSALLTDEFLALRRRSMLSEDDRWTVELSGEAAQL